jgi:hypothetical protein
VEYLPVDDFNYDHDSPMSEIQVCQLRKISKELMWVPTEYYVRLKHGYAKPASSDKGEYDDDIVKKEDKNRQHLDKGRQTWPRGVRIERR